MAGFFSGQWSVVSVEFGEWGVEFTHRGNAARTANGRMTFP